jgi:hypothetical protein
MHKQRGMTFIGVVLLVAIIVFVATIAIKLTPAYLEFFAVKKVVQKIQKDPSFASMGPKEIMDSYYRSASIDNIGSVQEENITIEKTESGTPVITIEYQKVIPIVANVSALLDFHVSTDSGRKAAPLAPDVQ